MRILLHKAGCALRQNQIIPWLCQTTTAFPASGSLTVPSHRTSQSSAHWYLPPSLLFYFNPPKDLKFSYTKARAKRKETSSRKENATSWLPSWNLIPGSLFFSICKRKSLNYNSLKPVPAGSSASPGFHVFSGSSH